MANESPVQQIFAMVDGESGKVFECRGYEEVVAPNSADGGIWVEAGEDGICVGGGHGCVDMQLCGRLV